MRLCHTKVAMEAGGIHSVTRVLGLPADRALDEPAVLGAGG